MSFEIQNAEADLDQAALNFSVAFAAWEKSCARMGGGAASIKSLKGTQRARKALYLAARRYASLRLQEGSGL